MKFREHKAFVWQNTQIRCSLFYPKTISHLFTINQNNMKKNQFQGKKLSRKELKSILGGVPPTATQWRCIDENGLATLLCFVKQPYATCGYAEPCTVIGICSNSINICLL